MTALMLFSKYFGIAIDTLLNTDLNSLSESQLSQLEKGGDVYIRGSNIRVLATTVDKYNACLLYTSDAADDLLCVDLGGRGIMKKKKNK